MLVSLREMFGLHWKDIECLSSKILIMKFFMQSNNKIPDIIKFIITYYL